MTNEDSKRHWGQYAGIGIPVMLILYVLSLGPATWLQYKGYLSRESIETIYYPIVIVVENNEYIEDSLKSYTESWLPTVRALRPQPTKQ